MPLASGVGDIYCLPIDVGRQLTATTTEAQKVKVPFKGRMIKVVGGVGAIGGSVVPTDVDLMIQKGVTDLLTAPIPAVDASAIAATPPTGSVVAAQEALAEDDVINLDVTVTGGTSPTVNGIFVHIWLVRE
jgi:hypothetical protein